jgi:hypothetical protein
MQGRNGEAAYFQRASPFLLRHSPYALDFYTAVVLFASHEDTTEAEIAQELSKHVRPLGFEGPRIKTILRWLRRFREDAKEHTSFFTQKLSEHHLVLPPVLTPDKQRETRGDYVSLYFLECLGALCLQLHPKEKGSRYFLWHANTLLLNHGKRGLFAPRRPP